ncbi:MAG TPA: aminotransferase class V-fold PLP-dependent enzyme [Gemmatimonadales bacterium]|jgi:selenocysteine lyase/cysteine desulfurase|nr:aminotransferase class V-fold PLP-dependent enzyme [Gemmatimonadales bacterium]
MRLIPCQRHLFEIPEDVAYFNCAYMSPLLKRVRETGEAAVGRKSRPWEIAPADFFTGLAETRNLFGRLLGARPEDIAVIPAVSYGMATAARNTPLGPGQRVLLLAEGFPSTIYAWKERAAETGAEAVLLPRPADDDWTRVVLEAIDSRTGAAALPHCHWTDGGLLDLTAIAGRLREVGAVLALDVTQSLGAMPFDLGAVRPDWLVAATYKWLLGPYSMGFLYAAPQRQQGIPLEHNWMAREGAEDFAALVNYAARFEPGARRYDVGEPSNFALTPMVAEALRQLLEWGVADIYETLSVRTAEIAARAAGLGIGAVPAERRAGHYLGLRFRDGVPPGLPERLRQARVHVSVRGAALRVTPHLWTTDQDVERLFKVLG